MTVRQATEQDKDKWNAFVEASPENSFLQSFEYGEMQRELNVPFWRFIAEDEAGFQGTALVLKRNLPGGLSWLYVPRGPVLKEKNTWGILEKKLIDLAKEAKAIFLRADPKVTASKNIFANSSWQKANREVQPKNTLMTDITPTEDGLLTTMHSKTRYNIRLAERKGVKVRFSSDIKELDKFFELAKDVSDRSNFNFHPPEYYQAMCRQLIPAQKLELAIAESENEALAVHVIVTSGDTATYVHGASSAKHRNLMAPYLLQWKTIQRMKAKGFKYYDWFGVAPKGSAQDHPWHGITRFKEGFGGKTEEYIGAYDFVMRPFLYKLYKIVKKFRG